MSSAYLGRLERTLSQHEEWRTKECLNLIPSENRGSRAMRSMFLTDLGNRYTAPDRFYRGTRYADELTSLVEEMARKVFNARYADVRPLSGHTADMAVILSRAGRGDTLLSVNPENGGYPGITHLGLGGILGLKNEYFPYDDASVNIDAKRAAPLIRRSEPSLTFFGSSFIPFPHPVRELTRSGEAGTCVFDGSHVLGLIAGGEFQDPLKEGCSLLIGSTHKSLPGPQGGIILSNDEETFMSVSGKIHPGIVDNVHLNRVAALGVALLEMMEFGRAYAKAVIANSQVLAKALAAEGVKVRGAAKGYTKSHQVLLGYDMKRASEIAERLERANMIVDNAGRVGTGELTRLGMGPQEMEVVAEMMASVILGKKGTDVVKRKAASLSKQYQEPKYALKPFQWLA